MKGMREGATGKRKWFRETVERWFLHRDTGEERYELRTIDREADMYDKVIKDESGAIVHECHEQLSAHQRHGDARGKRDN
jgi:hypothetical protein